MDRIQSIKLDSIPLERWRNGNGVTRTVAKREGEWRVSVAEIERDGLYSQFNGMVRVSMVLEGDGVILDDNDAKVVLEPMKSALYDGAVGWHATLIGGAIKVLNVMASRHRDTPEIQLIDKQIELPEIGSIVIISLDTDCVVSGDGVHHAMAAGEFLIMEEVSRRHQLFLSPPDDFKDSNRSAIRFPILVTL